MAAIAVVAAALLALLGAFLVEWWKNWLRRRGIASLLSQDFHRWEGTIAEAYYRRRWWFSGDLLAGQTDADDMKRAATALKPREWGEVSSAKRWIDYLGAVRDRRNPAPTEGEAAPEPDDLTEDELRWMRETFYRLETARYALLRQASPFSKRFFNAWAKEWKPYGHQNLEKRFVPRTGEKAKAMVSLEDPKVMASLLQNGVSTSFGDTGELNR